MQRELSFMWFRERSVGVSAPEAIELTEPLGELEAVDDRLAQHPLGERMASFAL
jgi:hypothetical protein